MVKLNDPQLAEVRKEIDIVDNQILELIEDRFELVEKVIQIKKEKGLPIYDVEREKAVIESKLKKSDLPEDFVRKLYGLIIDTVAEMEEKRIK